MNVAMATKWNKYNYIKSQSAIDSPGEKCPLPNMEGCSWKCCHTEYH